MIIETLFYIFLILCLCYGIKETMDKWDGEDE